MRRRWMINGFLLLCFLVNQGMQQWFRTPAFCRNYADDLLAVPLILSGFHLLLIYVYRKGVYYRLPLVYILLTVVALTFHFEVLLPYFSAAYTADMWDVGMYAIGGFFYLLFLNGLPVATFGRFIFRRQVH